MRGSVTANSHPVALLEVVESPWVLLEVLGTYWDSAGIEWFDFG